MRSQAHRSVRIPGWWIGLALMLLSAALVVAAGWLIWVAVALAVTQP